MKNGLFFLGLLLIGSNLYAQTFQSIFNGKDLTGWTNNGTEKWYVDSSGALVCESGPNKQYGYLSTDKQYKDFELKLVFKQEANGNSGVFVRSAIEGIKISGWQVEIAPENLHTGGIYESYGRGWLIQPKPADEKWLQMGKWNAMKILVKGDEITSWLNGHKIGHFKDEKFGKGVGFIALQIHEGGGIKVRWKNIMLKELK